MPTLGEGVREALRLLVTLDPQLIQIIGLSLRVSGAAIIISSLVGLPLGVYLGFRPPRSTRLINRLIYTLMGMPPVVAGLAIYLLLSRRGPLGVLGLLYTPAAMIIAQVLLAVPIVTGLAMASIQGTSREVEETARVLGADRLLMAWTVVMEARFALATAVITGFARVISEVGAVMIVGGNIEGYTRQITTAIVLETRRGNFGLAIGLGMILLLISFGINVVLHHMQGEGRR